MSTSKETFILIIDIILWISIPCNMAGLSLIIWKIKKVKDNFVWLDKVAYPFKINTKEVLFIDEILYARIIYINNEWYLKEFLMEPNNKNYERL